MKQNLRQMNVKCMHRYSPEAPGLLLVAAARKGAASTMLISIAAHMTNAAMLRCN